MEKLQKTETPLSFRALSVHSFIRSLNKHLLRADYTLLWKIKGLIRYIFTHEELSNVWGAIIHPSFLAPTASKG